MKAESQCLPDQFEFIVHITPDDFPAETSWDVLDVNSNITVASGAFNSDTICLDTAGCYQFTIYDQIGDGICCGFGNGSYALYLDNVMIKSGGNFGFTEITSFGCAPVAHDLPLVVINTNGQVIPDEPGIIAEMGIINNANGINYKDDPFNDYDGYIHIEIRGQSSQWFPKKNYGFETTDQFGVDSNFSLLGLPEEEDWILHGPYSDKSLIRNVLAMNIATEMGYYASRKRFCEVYVNDEYIGVYILMEKIKRDKNRVAISKLTNLEVSGDDVTGGYIFRIDKGTDPGWNSQYDVATQPGTPIGFKYVYPKATDIVGAQQNYIRSYVDSFEMALASSNFYYGGKRYDEYVDLPSFVDNYIINEVSKNVDAYRISTYFHKDKNNKGGKIVAMPVWDYNLAFDNADYCDGSDYSGWIYDRHCDDGNPFWIAQMRKDTAFQDILKCRWDKWKTNVLNPVNLDAYIDSLTGVLVNAQARNFNRWQILGTYVWPNPTPYSNTHLQEMDRIKTFLTNRISWMDGQITGTPNCELYEPPVDHIQQLALSEAWGYPNPFYARLTIQSDHMIEEIVVMNTLGQLVDHISAVHAHTIDLDAKNWSGGVYVVKLTTVSVGTQMIRAIKR